MLQTRQSIGGLGNLMFKQAYLIGKMLDREIPDVYVQSPKYWANHADEIKEFFNIGIPPKTDKVAIHIRRGDYLKADHFHSDLSKTTYYQEAVKMFPNEKFLVFCKDNQGTEQDMVDRNWVTKFMNDLAPGRWELVRYENTEVDDLNLMASCKGLIMANSTFSWWAAFLGVSKMVVCPKQWFVDGVQRIELLDDWIKL